MTTAERHLLDPIPVANLLRMAFFAGALLEEAEECAATHDYGATFEELLRAMLASAADRIRRGGFERGYFTETNVGSQPTGRLLFNETIARRTFASGRIAYRFDEFGVDTPHNRVLKACARLLSRTHPADHHQDSLRALVREMREVQDAPLSRASLQELPRSPASRRYRVVRFVARLLIDSGQPDERVGEQWARRLVQDRVRMRKLFERFVYRFARHFCPKRCQVGRDRYEWSETRHARMPRLETDVTIRRRDCVRVIECKYTPDMLVDGPHGAAMYRAEHLRQLFAYLSRARAKRPGTNLCIDGLLLYPAVTEPAEVSVQLGEFPCTIASLGLSKPWPGLADQLIRLQFG